MLAILLLAAFCSVDTGKITGTVVEARTNAPLAAVLVKIPSTGQQAFSDAEGHFEIDNVPTGPQTLVVSVVGYGLVRREVVVSATEVVDVTIPVAEGAYSILLWAETTDRATEPFVATEIALTVEGDDAGAESCMSVFLDAIARTLPRTHQLQELPSEYVDVTEGAFAPVKRFLKRKVLHNFKHAYVDVLSRQQTQMNGNVVAMIQQLAECCTLLDQRLAALEKTGAAINSGRGDDTEANARSIHG